MFADHLSLIAIGGIAPAPGFSSMQQIRQDLTIVHIGSRRHHRVNQLALTIYANTKIPLISLLGLMHLRNPLLVPVLGRARCVDNRGVHNGSFADLQAILLQIFTNQDKQLLTQVMGFKKMTEIEYRRLIRCRFAPQVYPSKLTLRSIRSRPTGRRPVPSGLG